MSETFRVERRIGVSAEELYGWHARPRAFERLTPPWEPVEVLEKSGGFEDGEVRLRVAIAGPVRMSWKAIHHGAIPGRQFQDRQEGGPFASWNHTHRFEPDGEQACRLVDDIAYRLPLGPLGKLGGGAFVRRKLSRMFAWRHALTAADLEQDARATGGKRLRFGITGGNPPPLGPTLSALLETLGHVLAKPGEPTDVLFHLGTSLEAAPWLASKPQRVIDLGGGEAAWAASTAHCRVARGDVIGLAPGCVKRPGPGQGAIGRQELGHLLLHLGAMVKPPELVEGWLGSATLAASGFVPRWPTLPATLGFELGHDHLKG